VNGTRVPNIAVCHLCGIPALSRVIAIITAVIETTTITKFSIHGLSDIFFIASHALLGSYILPEPVASCSQIDPESPANRKQQSVTSV
jgi:hypothetical protein